MLTLWHPLAVLYPQPGIFKHRPRILHIDMSTETFIDLRLDMCTVSHSLGICHAPLGSSRRDGQKEHQHITCTRHAVGDADIDIDNTCRNLRASAPIPKSPANVAALVIRCRARIAAAPCAR